MDDWGLECPGALIKNLNFRKIDANLTKRPFQLFDLIFCYLIGIDKNPEEQVKRLIVQFKLFERNFIPYALCAGI